MVSLRGLTLTAARPRIIVPLFARDPAALCPLAKAASADPAAELVELRLDPLPADEFLNALALVRGIVDKPLVVTIRTRAEGGELALTPDAYAAHCRALLARGGVDVLDIEWRACGAFRAELRDAAHAAGAAALFSEHHFDATPATDAMADTLTGMADAGADILVYGMGEYASREIARRLKKKEPVASLIDIRGTAVLVNDPSVCAYPSVTLPSFEEVRTNIRAYADATRIEYAEHDPIRGRALIQQHDKRWLIVNPPAMPLTSKELDFVAELPYTRQYHPMYEPMGGVPGLEEVKFSVIHNRGCFGGCNFCSLAFHQGRMVTSRSHESVIREVTALTKLPDFKGYINDVGGPSANFRHYSCQKQAKCGMCAERRCLAPTPCPNLDADHSDYLALLRKLRAIPGIKKVFVRSGIRYDYMLQDKNDDFFAELVKYHISGQLKVAPEHCIDSVLDYMGKPHIDVYERFMDKYKRLNNKFCKEQYIVPYLMSSHPGSTLQDAVALAEYLNKMGRQPEQVQDFYPTPGTISTCMYYTGIDPTTMKSVYVAKTFHEKAMQRALLQWKRPDKRRLVIEALKEAGREDLIGYGPECLVRPDAPQQRRPKNAAEKPPEPKKPQNKQGWAKAKPKKNTRPGKGKR